MAELQTPRRDMVGVLLRDARERRGEDVEAVAHELHIRRVYLEALEAGHLLQLPGQAYAVGFVRTYAEYLGLDAEEMVERLKAELGKVEGKAELLFPAPASDGGIPGGALIAISAVLAAIVYGAWYYASSDTENALDFVPAVPAKWAEALGVGDAASNDAVDGKKVEIQDSEKSIDKVVRNARTAGVTGEKIEVPAQPDATAQSVATVSDQAETGRPVSDTASETPVVTSGTGEGQRPTQAMTQPPVPALPVPAASPPSTPPDTSSGAQMVSVSSTTPPVTDSGSSSSAQNETQAAVTTPPPVTQPGPVGNSGIVVRARADSWIQIRGGEDTGFNVARMLRSGESYVVPNHPDLVLTTGNAGAIEIVINGRIAPPLGPSGAILRDLALDPEQLLAGAAVRQ